MTGQPQQSGTDDADAYRPAESVLDAERRVLGECMASRAAAEAAMETLSPDSFFGPEHATVFEAVSDLAGAGSPTEVAAVAHHLVSTGRAKLLSHTGLPLLANLVATAVSGSPRTARHYAQIVTDDAYRRSLYRAFRRGVQATGTPEFDPDAMDRLIADVNQAASRRQREDTAAWLSDDFAHTLGKIDDTRDDTLIPTPWSEFNDGVGLRTGQLVVVAAETGGGKSLWGQNLATHVSIDHGEGVLMNTLEMSREQLHWRILSERARVNLHRLIKRELLTDDDRKAIARVAPEIERAPMMIDDASQLTVASIRARVAHMRKKIPTRLVVVDYLQLLAAERRIENRALEVGEFAKSLRVLAKDEDLCVVALSQFNRGPSQRADKKPTINDLRESAAIGHEAAVVVLLHREDQFDHKSPKAGEIDMIIAKSRFGANNYIITCAFQGHYARIVDQGSEFR